jgi:KTSC domain
MKWTPVESSPFQAAAYAEGQALLYLLFRSGEVYRYFDVPRWEYQEFLAADFKGPILWAKHPGAFPLRARAATAVMIARLRKIS